MMDQEVTTENVQNEITRRTRERICPDHPLIDGWNWSPWVLAMIPDNDDNSGDGNFNGRTTEEYDRYGRKKKKAELTREFGNQKPCGIYEWKAKHQGTGKEYVVYIGSTCRSKVGNFIGRIYQYCTNGSHKSDYIETALENGYRLYVRYKGSSCRTTACESAKKEAEDDENKVLKQYDYAWNKRLVKEIERDLPIY